MRIFSLITALVVAAVLYGLVLERDRLLGFAGVTGDAEPETPVLEDVAQAETAKPEIPEGTVRVIALRSTVQEIDSAVFLRGETAALRQVEVRAETSGKIISEPLRKGAQVAADQLLCAVDPGTSDISLRETMARLLEAKARLPEAAARLSEAKAQIPASKARILEAEAAVPAAEARLLEARAGIPAAAARLAEAQARVPEAEAGLEEATSRIPEAEARLAEAEAAVPAAKAALAEAETRLPEAEARLVEAKARVAEAEINLNAAQKLQKGGFAAKTRLAGAEAAYEAAKAGVQSALAGLKAASSGIEGAKSRLQGALAGVQSAKSQVEAARVGVQSAQTQIQNAKAGVQNAQSQVEGAKAAVETALSAVEGAKAAVILAKSQLESSEAGVKAAMTGEESARSAIQSAEAAIAGAEMNIDRLGIHAPFAGLLETDTAELGALLQPGAACATIIQLDPVKIVGFVPEAQVARVKLGANAAARLVDDREVFGQVTFVARSADPLTRTFRVELTLPNPDLSIRDGQTADLAIEAEGAKAHLIPQSALTLDNDGSLGIRQVTEAGTAEFLPVRMLRDTVQGVWVAGLPDTVDIITVGQEYVTDGVPVAPSFEEVIQ
ncbi:Efflux pump periplasmic linker BepF [Pelagimonas phthalicica]|uniref:Efflux pump periplasmic linker BepF n=2 Tax=Pelagimonas phthalicica TaxID=1037362 RepID=A0A238JFB7_9RHOB|nr:efflux RND transporter periplasmic adaptor subunit [Pelagimonas phthalicica]TDS91854.1 RND family efflux transporter MFP subunit [Pelagimonas phthalicica]SMX28904.1 Efflux pump periplasmic linker BepF [Pelagimonas phthalicica]